jgi:hypothetical protein
MNTYVFIEETLVICTDFNKQVTTLINNWDKKEFLLNYIENNLIIN